MVGYFNTVVAERQGVFEGVPGVVKYFIMAFSGTGPLWFVQVLWLLCLVLLAVRALDRKDKFWTWCGKASLVWVILLGVLFWLGEQTLVKNPRPETLDGLLNLYKPPLMACAVVAGGILIGTTFGQDNTSPQYLGSPLNCIYGWLMCLAMMAWFQAKFDCTNPFATYMTRSSYGIYIVHYLVIASLGYMMKTYTQLPPWSMYAILAVAVFTLSPLLYEILRRIPFVRWAVFGEKKS